MMNSSNGDENISSNVVVPEIERTMNEIVEIGPSNVLGLESERSYEMMNSSDGDENISSNIVGPEIERTMNEIVPSNVLGQESERTRNEMVPISTGDSSRWFLEESEWEWDSADPRLQSEETGRVGSARYNDYLLKRNCKVLCYEACVRLCFMLAIDSPFVRDECKLLKEMFKVYDIVLQTEAESYRSPRPLEILFRNEPEGTPVDHFTVKHGRVSEVFAFDVVLDAALKGQQFGLRNLSLQGQWRWLVDQFGLVYGVSPVYMQVRYLSRIMEFRSPTTYCLDLIHDHLQSVKNNRAERLSSVFEDRLYNEVAQKIEQLIADTFEDYKSLDESVETGMITEFEATIGRVIAPALIPAIRIFGLLHDPSLREIKIKLCAHFQKATKKRSVQHFADIDDLISRNGKVLTLSMARRMISICQVLGEEISADIIIQQENLPSFVELPELSSSIYVYDLKTRLEDLLDSCPPNKETQCDVLQLLIATDDLLRNLSLWNISGISSRIIEGVYSVAGRYIVRAILRDRDDLLQQCKVKKMQSRVLSRETKLEFSAQIGEIYAAYELILERFPVYRSRLHEAMADVVEYILKRPKSNLLAISKRNWWKFRTRWSPP